MDIQDALAMKWFVVGCTLIAAGYLLAVALSRSTPHLKLFIMLAVLYPLGKALQYYFSAPQLLRFYLSDVGFVPFTGYFIFQLYRRHFPGRINTPLKYVQLLAKMTRYALVIAMAVELLQIYTNQYITPGPHVMVARGDVVDALLYVAVYLMCEYWLLARLERLVVECDPPKKHKRRSSR